MKILYNKKTVLQIESNHTVYPFENIGLLLITFYMLTSFVYYAVLESPLSALYPMSLGLLFCIFGILRRRERYICLTSSSLLWLLTLIPFFLSVRRYRTNVIVDLSIYAISVLMLCLCHTDMDAIKSLLFFIFILSIVYALATIWQYFFLDTYKRIILPYFSEFNQGRLLRNLNYGYFSGITSQVSFTGGYIVLGLCIALFSKLKIMKHKFTKYAVYFILFSALLLNGKRSILLCLLLAYVVTEYFSSKKNKRFQLGLKIIIGFSIAFVLIYFISVISNNPYIATNRIVESFIEFMDGEDISNGRNELYTGAVNLIKNNPLKGIGWRQFGTQSFGLISENQEVQVHNVYLQLLCETGIFGFLSYVIAQLVTFFHTCKALKYCKTNILYINRDWFSILKVSIFIQTFFISYSFFENALYDKCFLVAYFLSCLMLSVYQYNTKKISTGVGQWT